jgi:HD-GYP domain-containing protein (c-di-GMP phosphodiesterase class II)
MDPMTEAPLNQDPPTAVDAQFLMFARELGELYTLERERSQDLEAALESLQETYLSTITSLAQVIESKDASTRGHLDRTRTYGVALAERVDPELAARPDIGYGFFLHDIGKVGVPEQILCKRGPLTDAEWEVMRAHPTIGAQIVEPIQFLHEAVDIVRHHHERFDGAGYPDGLRREEIPLAARIFAVADSFDAMTSDRPYRDALAIDQAIDEVRIGAGTQFDPEVVKEFLTMIEDRVVIERAWAHSLT